MFQSLFWVVKKRGLAIEFDTTKVLDIDSKRHFIIVVASTVLTAEGVNGTRANTSAPSELFDPWKLLDDIFNINRYSAICVIMSPPYRI